MGKITNDGERIGPQRKAFNTKNYFKWLGKAQWCRECLLPVFQWFKTCWCLKEIFRTILCLEGVLFYFSFCTASIWNKSPWVCYILKTQLKTLIGSGPPDHITLVAQYTLTFSNQSKGVGGGELLRLKELFQVCFVVSLLQTGRKSGWLSNPHHLTTIPNEPMWDHLKGDPHWDFKRKTELLISSYWNPMTINLL